MGIPSGMRDMWVNNRRNALLIPSPYEDEIQHKALRAKTCTQEGARQGFKAACIWGAVSAVPTLAAVRTIPWAKANLNYTAQALMISAASIAAYFITADKTILECARKNAQLQQALSRQQ
ncbi:putative early nodulin 93 ENOD93 protein [Rosa chinensis]|uniref:Putative early nodulin 93 ENOD93 protein n=1 Tax=Rosa chinensis TaxID=74649 RepID=A0A2P6Q060_ROSCH|nr:early nodulin-93 [Rosa chinensis]PRQ27574.1 putative early nodulin 93 ENOD93 protein [Rosa chinensis]